jgi:hypothetical protein
MRIILKSASVLAITALFSVLAFAESWSGALVDASCWDNHHSQDQNKQENSATGSCAATSSTTTFGIMVAGKVYKFDEAGNTKAGSALKNRADRSAPGSSQGTTSGTMAKVEGTKNGDIISVDSVEVQ